MAKYDHLSPLPPEAAVSIVLLSNYPLKNSSQRMKIDFTLFLLTTYFFPLQFILLFDLSKFFYFTLNVANWFCLITIQHCDTIWYYFGPGQNANKLILGGNSRTKNNNWTSILWWKRLKWKFTLCWCGALHWQYDLIIYCYISPVTTLNNSMRLKYQTVAVPQIFYMCRAAFLGFKMLLMWIHRKDDMMEMWTAFPMSCFCPVYTSYIFSLLQLLHQCSWYMELL